MDAPKLLGHKLQVTVEEHHTGVKGILELCEFWDGFRWTMDQTVLSDLEPRPTVAKAVRYLTEALKDTHVVHWPRKLPGPNTKYSGRLRRVTAALDCALTYELNTVAALHGISGGEMLRKIALDYLRPGAPQPLPPISKEYIQTLLEPYRKERWTSGAVTPGKRKKRQ